MTEDEVMANPLVRCAGCKNLMSLQPALHQHYQPMMMYGEFYHSRCTPQLAIPTGVKRNG